MGAGGGDDDDDASEDSELERERRHANAWVGIRWYELVALIFQIGSLYWVLFHTGPQRSCPFFIAPPDMSVDFPERKYFMDGPTGSKMDWVDWEWLRSQACAQYEVGMDRLNNPLELIGQQTADAIAQQGGMLGALIAGVMTMRPCYKKMNCMAAMSTRCYFYGYFQMEAKVLLWFGIGAAGVFAAAGVLLILCQRKKYKLWITVLYGLGCMMGMGAWYYIADGQGNMYAGLGAMQPYPYPLHTGCGANIIYGCLGVMFFGCCCSCCAVIPEKETSDSDDG